MDIEGCERSTVSLFSTWMDNALLFVAPMQAVWLNATIYAKKPERSWWGGFEAEQHADSSQFVESRGIHIIPYSYLQRRFKATNVRSLVRDNVAFKLSFGLTFALAAFAEF